MNNTSEITRETVTKPVVERLKTISRGISIGHVIGNRVLVKTIDPETKADRLEQQGILVQAETVKEANRPPPSMGLVLQVGGGVNDQDRAHLMPQPPELDGKWAPGAVVDAAEDFVGVFFSPHSGSDWVVENEGYRILDVPEILCTLKFPPGGLALEKKEA